MLASISKSCQHIDTIPIKADAESLGTEMNWLRTRREYVGIHTQEEFARLLQLSGLSISRAAISHWENGRYDIPLKDVRIRSILAKVLKLSEPELLSLAGYETLSSHSAAGERAAAIVDRLPAHKQELAIKLLEQVENT